ncbi:hypothetical protein U1737_18815 [Sphingomonas sp. LB3N6]|uniref:hypothetical protein n=1 Tax=Sphingomonas fucosidasi TaxID=3096164 RepID=UPI002FC7854E
MKRFLSHFALLAIAQPALAGGDDAPYYGPMKRWHGIGFQTGYRDRTEKDGSWRVDAAIHGRTDAIDMALYRAAQRAHELGYRYLFLLGGNGSKTPGQDMATVYARPSHEAVPPTGCRSKKLTTCYTADVLEIMRILGGPNGSQPGVPILAGRDEFGRDVFSSGYGTGGVTSLVPGMVRSQVTTIVDGRLRIRGGRPPEVRPGFVPVALPTVSAQVVTRPVPPPALKYGQPAVQHSLSTDAQISKRFERALKAAQPVRGGESNLGWTISD